MRKHKNPNKKWGHASRVKRGIPITEYISNSGKVYSTKMEARLSSVLDIFFGCLHNGFPVYLRWVLYEAWAFWPFFFVRRKLKVSDPIPLLNHERIHCRQQWDLHITFSLPLLVVIFFMELYGHTEWLWGLVFLPFIPTAFYGLSMIRAFIELLIRRRKITFNTIREETCFERESNMHQNNWMYLGIRKYMGVLAYTCIPWFRNYGMNYGKKR